MKTDGNFFYAIQLAIDLDFVCMLTEVPVIRVKEFAKVEYLPAQENETNGNKENGTGNLILPINIETISLSSEDEVVSVATKGTKSIAKTPKPREKRLPRVSSAISKNRTPRLPSQYKFHKIDEYFNATKKDCKFIVFLLLNYTWGI